SGVQALGRSGVQDRQSHRRACPCRPERLTGYPRSGSSPPERLTSANRVTARIPTGWNTPPRRKGGACGGGGAQRGAGPRATRLGWSRVLASFVAPAGRAAFVGECGAGAVGAGTFQGCQSPSTSTGVPIAGALFRSSAISASFSAPSPARRTRTVVAFI